MRRIFFVTSTLVLSVATLTWTAAPSGAGKGRGGGGHAGGGHAAPAHVGSVHYATRPAPARVAPVHVAPVHVAPAHVAPVRVAPARVTAPAVRTGSVRSEHYAGAGSVGGYHNRYRDDYFRRFRPGYIPFVLSDGYEYYGYYDLPPGYEQVVEDGITYYLFDGIYYMAYIIGGQTVYVVVPDQ